LIRWDSRGFSGFLRDISVDVRDFLNARLPAWSALVKRKTTSTKTLQEETMKHLSAFAIAALLLTGGANAEQTSALHGLFCNTEAQAREVLEHYSPNMSLHAAVGIINEEAVNCVVADSIKYIVSQPLIIDTITQKGFKLTMYEASLVGILIGGNTRPVAPPVRTFFVLDRRLGGVATLSGT
jgi:hypothetical protein